MNSKAVRFLAFPILASTVSACHPTLNVEEMRVIARAAFLNPALAFSAAAKIPEMIDEENQNGLDCLVIESYPEHLRLIAEDCEFEGLYLDGELVTKTLDIKEGYTADMTTLERVAVGETADTALVLDGAIWSIETEEGTLTEWRLDAEPWWDTLDELSTLPTHTTGSFLTNGDQISAFEGTVVLEEAEILQCGSRLMHYGYTLVSTMVNGELHLEEIVMDDKAVDQRVLTRDEETGCFFEIDHDGNDLEQEDLCLF